LNKLLDIACKKADSAEVYFISGRRHDIKFENYALVGIENRIQSGYCLRVLKDGLRGMSYTKNFTNREGLVERALESLMGNVRAGFSFPKGYRPVDLKSYDPEIEELTLEKVINSLKGMAKQFSPSLDGQLNIDAGYSSNRIRILNSNGLDIDERSSLYYARPMILFPNSYASVKGSLFSRCFNEIPEGELFKMRLLYSKGIPEISPEPDSMSVIFSPHSIFTLMWRICEAASAKALFEDISPIKERIGQRIFSQRLTIKDNLHIMGDPFARGFDDEGSPTSKFSLIENGVFKGFYNNLDYADRLETEPTGHGYRSAIWGGEAITLSPMPKLANLRIEMPLRR
jgi:PmbA protein